MIKVNEEYYIGFQPRNIVLYKVKIAGEKSKSPGEKFLKEIGFFDKIDHIIDSLLNDKIKSFECETLQELKESINEFKLEILKSMKKIDIKEELKNIGIKEGD